MVPVRKSLGMQVDGAPRGRGRPKRTWMEVIKIDLQKCNLCEDLAHYRSELRNKIRIAQHSWDKALMMMMKKEKKKTNDGFLLGKLKFLAVTSPIKLRLGECYICKVYY
eukprot:TRINITY_DN16862_c0_g1_i2.p1 TRINITY_DN16862_c0_g1~~TRINITY_DN16862_c0_g1_i2.p1  ORF type:complete len:109 (-),score=11.66 TRINITY_DN16862_c0_g1_i2:684-1010(-)